MIRISESFRVGNGKVEVGTLRLLRAGSEAMA